MRRFFLIVLLSLITSPLMSYATTISCSTVPGGSSCGQCTSFELTNSQSAVQAIVPRNSLLATEREFVYTDQSSIIAQTYQNATVTPTGTITGSYTLLAQGSGTGPWNWATMSSGTSIVRGTIPAGIDRSQPVYSIKYTVKSGVKDNGEIQNGLDNTQISCVYYFVSAGTAINGTLGPKHATTLTGTNGTMLTSTSVGLCSSGTVTNFAYSNSQKRWTWTCAGLNGGTSINGYAHEQSPMIAINGSVGPRHNTTITSTGGSALTPASSGLCDAGNLVGFQYRSSERRWTWTCAGINGGSDAQGFAYENSLPADNCRITASDTHGVAPLNVSLLCTGVSGQGFITLYRDNRKIQNLAGFSRNFEFTRGGSYRATCFSQDLRSECSVDITLSGLCGNNIREDSEECDDGNTLNGDLCDRSCHVTPIYEGAYCGNGYVERGEECDDGNNSNTDSCTNFCEDTLVDSGPRDMVWILCAIALLSSTSLFFWRRGFLHR